MASRGKEAVNGILLMTLHSNFPLLFYFFYYLPHSSIKPKAIQFGICRVVPPEGWRNTTQVDFKSKKKFATKLQRMSLMQEGRSMGDGNFYDAQQYEKMANDFRQSW